MRWLFLTHRWLGILLCIPVALWFASGIVMLYIGYPKLTPWERLSHLPVLDIGDVAAIPRQVGQPDELRLVMVSDTSVFLARHRNKWAAYDFRNGEPLKADASLALASARAFMSEGNPVYLGEVLEDTWTHSRALDSHRPLHRIAMNDAAGTELYVSSQTGEVVRDASHMERAWNYIGTWLHWLYMFRGGKLDAIYLQVVIGLSSIGTLMLVLGVWIGISRFRLRSEYTSRKGRTPYREPWKRRHHLLGLAFAATSILWMFSGIMVANPGKVFSARHQPANSELFAGGRLMLASFETTPAEAIATAHAELGQIKELRWHWFDGEPWYIAYNGYGDTRIVSGKAPLRVFAQFDFDRLFIAAERSLVGAQVIERSVLTTYDNWYLQRVAHSMEGHIERRLPVLRIEFGDTEQTWLHVDPYTGTIHNQLDERRRWRRWLFSAIHCWDFVGLIDRRPLWDLVMIVFCGGGLVLSVTSLTLSIRRLKRYFCRVSVRSCLIANIDKNS